MIIRDYPKILYYYFLLLIIVLAQISSKWPRPLVDLPWVGRVLIESFVLFPLVQTTNRGWLLVEAPNWIFYPVDYIIDQELLYLSLPMGAWERREREKGREIKWESEPTRFYVKFESLFNRFLVRH